MRMHEMFLLGLSRTTDEPVDALAAARGAIVWGIPTSEALAAALGGETTAGVEGESQAMLLDCDSEHA